MHFYVGRMKIHLKFVKTYPEFLVANQDPESGERRFGGSVNLPPEGVFPPIEEVDSQTSVAAVGLGAATGAALIEEAEDNQNFRSLFNCSGQRRHDVVLLQ